MKFKSCHQGLKVSKLGARSLSVFFSKKKTDLTKSPFPGKKRGRNPTHEFKQLENYLDGIWDLQLSSVSEVSDTKDMIWNGYCTNSDILSDILTYHIQIYINMLIY